MLRNMEVKANYEYMPIHKKIARVTLLSSICAVLLSAIFYGYASITSAKNTFIEKVGIFSSQLAKEESAAVHFGYESIAGEILAAFKPRSYIQNVWVMDHRGEILAQYSMAREKTTIPEFNGVDLENLKSRSRLTEFDNDMLNLLEPIVVDHHVIGSIIVQARLSGLYGDYFTYVIMTLCILLVLIISSVIISKKLAATITAPMMDLVEEMKNITREHDYSTRIKHHYQDEFGDLINNFNNMLADIESHSQQIKTKNKHLEQFAFATSHDLKEPLRKISVFSDLLQSDCGDSLSKDGNKYISVILESSSRMRSLLEGLIIYAHASKDFISKEQFDLKEVVEDIKNDLKGLISEKSGVVMLADDMPALVADKMQISSMLFNIISNGLKFHKIDEKPVVKVNARFLSKNESRNIAALKVCRITISDNGIGFEEKHQDRIFDVFETVHKREGYAGVGIGLGICKQIVERHNGSIKAISEPGKGTKFIIDMPAE